MKTSTKVKKTCSIENCDRKYHAKNFCGFHYYRHLRGVDLTQQERIYGRKGCVVDGCENKHSSKGYCRVHRRRQIKGVDLEKPIRKKHGLKSALEYNAWVLMKGRCLNPKNPSYKHYGGRGITVCEKWKYSFVDFLSDMGKKPSAEHSIDRIDNDKGYSKENCRWATQIEQARNQRIRKDNKTGFRGVYKKGRAWTVSIRANGKNIYLGHFLLKKDAILARRLAEEKYWE